MRILVIDDLLQAKIDKAFNKEGYTMMYVLEPQLAESYIMDCDQGFVFAPKPGFQNAQHLS